MEHLKLLDDALSKEKIKVDVNSSFTVGISTDPGVMANAAERLLGQPLSAIEALASVIIFSQMRLVIGGLDTESINSDRDLLIGKVAQGVEKELAKFGLKLINVNIKDITDDSGYLDALGKEAASRATNDAKIQVAQRDRDGNIGEADAQRDQRVQVSAAQATAVEGENLAKVKVAESDALRREREAEAERMASAAEKVKQAQALEEAYTSEKSAEQGRAEREKAKAEKEEKEEKEEEKEERRTKKE